MIATPPPAEPEYISVNAILFLADEERPRVISVRCRPPQHPSQGRCPVPALQPYFDVPPDNVVLTQGPNGEPLRSPLHIFYSSSARNRSSPCGNVVAFKFNDALRKGYMNAGSNDLPALSAYFLSYQ
ncbi:hypothetical protein B0H14DRAFT_3695012 [Mycena olivaceomarginata]|nr:hypothetical protein B0H14DRAFT_3695012 [Mycena olivaceomarginata]